MTGPGSGFPGSGLPGNGLPGPGELRALVREVLRDELRAVIREVLQDGLRDGLQNRLRDGLPAAVAGSGNPDVQRIEKGAVTERMVAAAAKAGASLVLGPRAVLTPLARDKARALGVPVQKEQ